MVHSNYYPCKIFCIIFFLMFSLSSSAQYTLQGNAKNSNNELMPFSTVTIVLDSIHTQVVLSDSIGNYCFKNLDTGCYKVSASMIGYLPQQVDAYIHQDTTIDFILTPATKNLQEITVYSQKQLIENKPDRLIINLEGNIETKGKTTTDILKQLPKIRIAEEAINMTGKESVLVYINDYPVRLSGNTLLSYLNAMPTEEIKSVEIISSPPAQYDAEGNIGIIRIMTKKNIYPGWKGYLQGAFRQNTYSSYVGFAYINYTGKKFFFDATLFGGSVSSLNQNEYYSYFPNATTVTFNPKKWTYIETYIKSTLGYRFSERSSMIANFQIPMFTQQIIKDIQNTTQYINPVSHILDSSLLSNGKTTINNYTYNADIFFKHIFKNKKSYFTLNAAYLNNTVRNERPFISITQINTINNTTENYNTNGNQQYNIYTSNADFSFPLWSCTVNTGAKVSFIHNLSNTKFFNVVNDNNIFVPSLSNEYKYNENIQAMYYSMEKEIKNWSFKAGLRAEFTQTKGKSILSDTPYKNNYINLFPSVYITHDVNQKNSISFSYTTRIDRPPYQYLDPFKWYISKYNYAVGNPFLKPSYIHNLELSYTYNNNFQATAYYTNQPNQFGQYVVLDSTNINNQIQQTDNFFNVQSIGINLYYAIKYFKWWESNIQADFSYTAYTSKQKSFANTYGYGGSIIFNNTIFFNAKKTLQGVINIEENIPGIYDYRNKKNYFKLDFGFNCILFKQRMELRLYASDIFKTANPEYYYRSNNIKQVYRNYFDTRSVKLTIVYKFGNWFNKTLRTPESGNTAEKKRVLN